MTTLNINKALVGNVKEASGKISLRERFLNYITENSDIIIGGLSAMNGNTHALKVYAMLKNER